MSPRSWDHRGSGNHSCALLEPLEPRVLLSVQPLPVVAIVASDSTAAETVPGQAADTGTYVIYRETAAGAPITTGNLTVKFARSGTATFGPSKDYTLSVDGVNLTTTSVPIPNGSDHVTVLLTPTGDSLAKPTETAVLTLAGGAGYSLTTTAADRKATVSIVDDTPVITAAVTAALGHELGSVPATFQLTRSGYTGGSLTVNIKLSGTAKNSLDYNNVPLTVTFQAGQATADVVITPKADDAIPEQTETVLLSLKSGTGYKVGTAGSLKASLQDEAALADFFPTTMGTWWEYTGKVEGHDFDAIQRIKQNATINGLLTTEMVTTYGLATIAADYFIVDANGLSVVRSDYEIRSPQAGTETHTYDTPLPTMPAACTLGASYSGQATYTATRTTGAGNTTGTETRTMVVASKATKVTVPFGTYPGAVEVTLTDTWTDADGEHGSTTKNYWLVRGIGVVKTTVQSAAANGQNGDKASFSYSASLLHWST
jgi:hypothetical protein